MPGYYYKKDYYKKDYRKRDYRQDVTRFNHNEVLKRRHQHSKVRPANERHEPLTRQEAKWNNREEMFRAHERLLKLDLKLRPRCFELAKEIYQAVEKKNIEPLKKEISFEGQITEENFFTALPMLLRIEEAQQAVEMRRFDKQDCLVHEVEPEKPEDGRSFAVELEGQADNAFVDISDFVILQDLASHRCCIVKVEGFREDLIRLSEKYFDLSYLYTQVNVYFISSGIAYEACQRALDYFRDNPELHNILFERSGGGAGAGDGGDVPQDEDSPPVELEPKIVVEPMPDLIPNPVDARLSKLNSEQRQAVVGILEARCRPKPYILFGPPGTGKTHTLVEAVVQIYLRSPRALVLFCANSNTCVEQTYEKLLATEVFTKEDLQRLRPGASLECMPRVVVTTNIKSTCLRSSASFDYVIIDEAGHAHEAESLVPCCSLKLDGCLVLAGDPKQLGPVVQSEQAGKNGLEGSMLERLMKWAIYQRQEEGDDDDDDHDVKYNPKFLTKLIDCYRCDPRILSISNELFYDNELKCLNKTPVSIMKIMRLQGPIQLLSCKSGVEGQPFHSHSWENRVEIDECIKLVIRMYKMGLMPDQIGVMTPYRKQVKELRKRLREQLRTENGDGFMRRTLNKRFMIKVDKLKMVPKDEEALAAQARNELRRKNNEVAMKRNSVDYSNYQYLEPVDMVLKSVREEEESDWICKIDTVDSFQGNEREVIIVSTVRTSTNRNLGFLNDARRFNVAMSRAKWLLVVVGNESVLKTSQVWNELLCNAQEDIKDWPLLSMLDNPFQLRRPLFRA